MDLERVTEASGEFEGRAEKVHRQSRDGKAKDGENNGQVK